MIDARLLHEKLGIETRFNDWIQRRIDEYKFVENEDFERFYSNLSKTSGGRPGAENAAAKKKNKKSSFFIAHSKTMRMFAALKLNNWAVNPSVIRCVRAFFMPRIRRIRYGGVPTP